MLFKVEGNVIEDCGHFGIQLTDAPKNGTIIGNTIKRITRGTYDEHNDFRGVGIKISSHPEVEYSIDSIEQMSENLVITNNNIINYIKYSLLSIFNILYFPFFDIYLLFFELLSYL